jgi:uncharacterized protein YprB with RNaseH-like and TPR domain
MRDLTARLREIVKRERAAAGAAGDAAPIRELTFEPDAASLDGRTLAAAASYLGGTLCDDGACLVIDRVWAGDRSHGRRRIESCVPDESAPVRLLDPRTAAYADWPRRVIFFDIETTGLSGGAGTLAFLVGCAWFEGGSLRVRQFFVAGPSGEPAMLRRLAEVFDDASLLVTYNGRSFDVPLMETRWAFHRSPAPTDDLPHFDMLPPARRLWSRREQEGSCSLSSLERSVIGFHRLADVPGFEIPARYFHFLRTTDARSIDGVLEHNRHDLVSLAVVMSHALWLVQEGPDACREPAERLALGRIYEAAGEMVRAEQAFDAAAATGDWDLRQHALARLAVLLRRAGRHPDAAAAWQGVLDAAPHRRVGLNPLERRAAEALAIHHEHRARSLPDAKHYATLLDPSADVQHRLTRIDRKIASAGNTKGDPWAAPLLDQ